MKNTVLLATALSAFAVPLFAASPGDIIINEIIQNPAAVGDAAGEWFELYNTTSAPIDIDGWTVKDDDIDSFVIANGGPLNVAAFGYVVLGVNADSGTNGGAPVTYQYPSNFFLANGADELVLLDGSAVEIDRVEWDGGALFPDPNGASMQLKDPALNNNVGGNWCEAMGATYGSGDFGTPGAANDCSTSTGPIGMCGDSATLISAIQGAGLAPALTGEQVIEGVIVGDYQGVTREGVLDPQLEGFFVQEEATDSDGNPATSEGIFVYLGNASITPPAVSAGDLVRVIGLVSEFSDATQVGNVSGVLDCGAGPAVEPTTVTLPVSNPNDFERWEGMLVRFEQDLKATDPFSLGRFGEVEVALHVLDNPTNVVAPGAEALALQDLNDRSRIVLDDGTSLSEEEFDPPARSFPQGGLSASNSLRVGSTLAAPFTAVLTEAFGSYRMYPLDPSTVTFEDDNPRSSDGPEEVGGTLRVATMNVLNYFDTIDTGAEICGPSMNQGCRGADSATELVRQRDKIVAALLAIDADVVGLVEIENDALGAIQDLVNSLNAAVGAGTYDLVNTGTVGTDAIRNAFIYKPATVSPVGGSAFLDNSVDPRAIDTKNRPPLAQTFEQTATGERFTAVINHFKSKGSDCDSPSAANELTDPDTGDLQGNCNLTRVSIAQALIDWLATDPTASGDADFLILGDLNAYAKEDPIRALTDPTFDPADTPERSFGPNANATYTDLAQAFITAEGKRAYSYTFFGQQGYLDTALANETLLPQVTGVTEWHINSDEPVALDYNEEWSSTTDKNANQLTLLYADDPFRSSDHDPIVIGLDLRRLGDVNRDGCIDRTDLTALSAAIRSGAEDTALYDLNGDGVVNAADMRTLSGLFDNPRGAACAE